MSGRRPFPWIHRLILCLLVLGGACARPAPGPGPEPWAIRPTNQWPPLTLTNRIRIGRQTFDHKGGAFLVDTGRDTVAAAAKHLFLAWKTARLHAVDFAGLPWHWTLYRRDAPADSVAVDRLLNADPAEELVKSHLVNRDWLVFTLAGSAPHVQPVKPGPTPHQGQTVYLVGWDAVGQQRIYPGKIVQMFKYKFLADFGTADVADLSGAPVLDRDGHLVGLHTGLLGKVSWVNSTRYLAQILAARTASP